MRWPLDGPITLRAKADIVIGRSTGNESRKVLIDLKTGRIVARHREDLRFYALVETLVPRASAEGGGIVLARGRRCGRSIAVTEPMLRSALRRTLDAISRIIELTIEGCSPKPPPSADCFRCRELDLWIRSAGRHQGDGQAEAGRLAHAWRSSGPAGPPVVAR